MKRTFRFLAMGLLAVGLLASCNKKENNNGTANGEGFKAITEQGGGNSKTYGVLTSDTQLEVRWKAGDQIKVSNGSETCTFQLTSGEDQTSGEFNRLSGTTFDYTTGDFTAIYPVVNTEGVENTVGASTATFNLPATQTFDTEHPGSFAEKAMPMMAHATEQTLYFKNVLGGVCFPLVGNGLHVTKVVLTSSSTTDMLWGVFNANYTNDEPTLTYVSGGSNSITLNCDVTLDATNATEFTIMVPPGTLAAGFTVAAYDGEIKIFEKSTSSAPGATFIPRNTIRVVDHNLNVVISALNVTTTTPTFITMNSAYVGGSVTANGKEVQPITERGICWGQTATPTIDDNYLADGSSTAGNFRMTIEGLTLNTVYYVRAYAKNTLGEVVYGNAIPFATRRDYVANGGKLNGRFSVGGGQSRNFAMGNLQYQASTSTWRYAEYQFEYVGYDNVGNVYQNGEKPNTSASGAKSTNHGIVVYQDPSVITTYAQVNTSNNNYNHNYQGWIDWFLWGTSGQRHNTAYAPALCQPWCRLKHYTTSPEYDWQTTFPYFHNNYLAYDDLLWAFNDRSRSLEGIADWACNTISNGSAAGKHTPSANNWQHLLKVRAASTVNGVANARFSYARLRVRNGSEVRGIFLFPDSFTWPAQVTHYPAHINYVPEINTMTWDDVSIFTEAEWSLLEQANVVFLPCCGCYGRTGHVEWGNRGGRYWSSTPKADTYGVYSFSFSPTHAGTEGTVDAYSVGLRYYGFAVRFMVP